MKKIVFLLTVLLLANAMQAQQINQISNFMYNQLYFNPASAGMHETQLNVNVLGRIQWASIEGAPKLGHVWADYRFQKQNMALGVNLGTFSYSKYSFTEANANYAFFVHLNKKVKLAMGLRAGITSIRSSTSSSTIWNEADPLIAQNNYSGSIPKIGLGFQLNAPNYFIGLSAPDLYMADTKHLLGDSASFFKQKRNFVLMGGTKIRLNDLYTLRPAVAAFYHPSTGAFAVANATFEIRDYFWLGASYSTYKAVALTAGAHLSTRIRFGYAYEFLSGLSRTASVGSHEICLMIKLDNLARTKAK